MSVIDVLRPVSVRKTGTATAIPSGTLAAVTSDNSDATYIRFTGPSLGSGRWSLRVEPHTLDAGYQRHQIRGRTRWRTDVGTASDDIDVGRGSSDFITYSIPDLTDTITEQSTGWTQDTRFGLATTGALSDLNIGGGYFRNAAGGVTELRTMECYIDVDCRLEPQYTAEIRDNAGIDQSGGTITDTTQPDLYFGVASYDGLPALDWSVTVTSGSTTVFTESGSGAPPESVPITISLPDATYTTTFSVRSTIRGVDPFANVETLTFTIQNTVPPPSPPLVEVVEQDGGYLVSWTNPGGQVWDDDYAVAELWRDDCTGSQRIATVPDGLSGSYLDLAIPQLDTRPDCEPSSPSCNVTYRVRYWGYTSTTVTIPDTIPAGLILAWPGTVGSLPAGWNRVTELDGRFPRGATGTGAPTTNGGAATHTHTTPNHTHALPNHSHSLGGSTGSAASTINNTDSSGTQFRQPAPIHTHSRPGSTSSAGAGTSGATSPLTTAADNIPLSRNVIWARTDGFQVGFPIGILGFSTETISGWTADAASSGRFLRGAATGGNGGVNSGNTSHNHQVSAHTHTGFNHGHSLGATGQSTPINSIESDAGNNSTQWLPQHTHPMTVASANTGSTNTGGTSTTSTTSVEPPHRRLRTLRNTIGGMQTRIIGLYTGAVSGMDPNLTLCNGVNGTPDMRSFFVRDIGSNAVNSTGGTSTHTHSVPTHSHSMPQHSHDTTVLTSKTSPQQASGGGAALQSASINHDHTSGNTGSVAPSVSQNGAGTAGSSSHIPLYREVHFVRLDGISEGGTLPSTELRISEYAVATVPPLAYAGDMDRIGTMTEMIAVPTDRTHEYPRLVVDSVPLEGGLHTVSSTIAGERVSLTIAVEGKQAIDELEEILSADRIYYSPLGGTPGWFAPAGWPVTNPTAGVWVVQVVLTRQPWPSVPEPEVYL